MIVWVDEGMAKSEDSKWRWGLGAKAGRLALTRRMFGFEVKAQELKSEVDLEVFLECGSYWMGRLSKRVALE